MNHPLSGAENIADRVQGELAGPELVPEWTVEQREADPSLKALGIPGCSLSIEQMLWEIQGRHMLGTQDYWGQAENFLCSRTDLCH